MSRQTRDGWLQARRGRGLAARRLECPRTLYDRRLRVEALEERRLLSITVDTLVDANDGVSVGGISLRDAIAAAAPGETIDFAPALAAGGPAVLQLSLPQQIVINKSLTIAGPGSNLLTIQPVGNDKRIFLIDDGNPTVDSDVMLAGLTLSGGNSIGGGGGAIASAENLTIAASVLSGNISPGAGGAIYSHGGRLTISDSTFTNNRTENASGAGHGGAVFCVEGDLTISRTTIESNRAEGLGGGIYLKNGNLTLDSSTISRNHADDAGGGLRIEPGLSRTALITSSTISGNDTWRAGGGISLITSDFGGSGSTWRIAHSTIAFNSAFNPDSVPGGGLNGGVRVDGTQPLVIEHTIVARNDNVIGDSADLQGGFVIRNSLIGNNNGSGYAPTPGNGPDANDNQIGSPSAPIDPLLGPLGINGGPTKTHALRPGSRAIDAGNLVPGIGGPTYDQRGLPFRRFFGAHDIGAYERQVFNSTIVVDSLEDVIDHGDALGRLTLREAIDLANGSESPLTISFAPELFASGPQTFTPRLGTFVLTRTMSIQGPGADQLVIDSTGMTAFQIDLSSRWTSLEDYNQEMATISNVTIDRAISVAVWSVGGLKLDGVHVVNTTGFAVLSQSGNLTIKASIIEGNRNGIRVNSGSLLLSDSVVRDNHGIVAFFGGGISLQSGTLEVIDSEISNNSSVGSGGGIRSLGDVRLVRTRVHGNSSGLGDGGGVFSEGAITAIDSALYDNHSGRFGGAVVGWTITLIGSRLYENEAGSDGGAVAGGIVVARDSAIDDNMTDARGGAIFGTTVTLINSSISGNDAANGGGVSSGHVWLFNSTVTGNSTGSVGGAGGVLTSTAQIDNSILAENIAPSGYADLYAGSTVTIGYSLLGDAFGTSLTPTGPGLPDAFGNLIGGGAFGPLDPLLGPMQDNGGRVPTHALLPGSPAINAADPSYVTHIPGGAEFDGRSAPFGRVVGGRLDMGAFELQAEGGDLDADFDADGDHDGADFLVWQRNLGRVAAAHAEGDATVDQDVDANDLTVWRVRFDDGENLAALMDAGSNPGAVGSAARDIVFSEGDLAGLFYRAGESPWAKWRRRVRLAPRG